MLIIKFDLTLKLVNFLLLLTQFIRTLSFIKYGVVFRPHGHIALLYFVIKHS